MASSPGRAETDPIVALATARGESALAVIRTTGSGSVELASRLFRGGRSPAEAPGHTLLHGRIVDPADGSEVDDVLLAVFRSPRSYTAQDGVEVSCHGGPAVVSRILGLFLSNGFRPALPGEFTLRAYLNGRMDLTRAEAVNEIVRARSDRARALALGRLSGAVAERIDAIKARVVGLLGLLELALDYPEEELEEPAPRGGAAREIAGEVAALLRTYSAGRLIQEGARLAIAGRPNAGKSTLFNLLLREDRSIVSDSPGTTRDYVEAAISIQGYGFRLYDTAGLREAEGTVEREGVRRAREVIEGADAVLYLVDATIGLHPDDELAMGRIPEARLVRLWSKADRASSAPPEGYLPCSARTGEGMEGLHQALLDRLFGADAGGAGEAGVPVIDSLRQKQLLERCKDALGRGAEGLDSGVPLDLVAVDVREALDSLGQITGEVSSVELLEAMFSTFCVGK